MQDAGWVCSPQCLSGSYRDWREDASYRWAGIQRVCPQLWVWEWLFPWDTGGGVRDWQLGSSWQDQTVNNS